MTKQTRLALALTDLLRLRVAQHKATRAMVAAKNDWDAACRDGHTNGSAVFRAIYVDKRTAFEAARSATGRADDIAISLGATLEQRQAISLKAHSIAF